jgi:hypothetical protein
MVQTQVTAQGWLGSTPEGRRPQIRGWRAGGSLAVANSTPTTPPQKLVTDAVGKLDRVDWHRSSFLSLTLCLSGWFLSLDGACANGMIGQPPQLEGAPGPLQLLDEKLLVG